MSELLLKLATWNVLFPVHHTFRNSCMKKIFLYVAYLNIGSMKTMCTFGKGGVALLWRKDIDNNVSPLMCDDDRIIGLQYQLLPSNYVFIFQLYLPCSNHSIDSFRNYIHRLYELWYSYSDLGTVIFMGDFNCSLERDGIRDKLFSKFLYDVNYNVVNYLHICKGANCTFVSYDDMYRSMIDSTVLHMQK